MAEVESQTGSVPQLFSVTTTQPGFTWTNRAKEKHCVSASLSAVWNQ